MGPAVLEAAGVDLVEGIFLGQLGRPDVGVHGGQAGVGRDVVEAHLLGLKRRRLLAEIEEHARGAHGREGARGHHIHFLGRLDLAQTPHGLDHFGGGQHHGLALLNAPIDFGDGLLHLMGHAGNLLLPAFRARRGLFWPISAVLATGRTPPLGFVAKIV